MKKLFKKLKMDSADSILTPFVIALPLLLMIFGFGFDVSKNIWAKNSYTSSAQASVQAAVKTINARGSLSNDSVRKVVSEFKIQNGYSASHTREAAAFETAACSTAEIDGVKRKLPYYEIKLETARGNNGMAISDTWKIEANNSVPNKTLPANAKYRVVSADIYTSTQNSWMGVFGVPCQVFKSSVSAIAFGNNQDLIDPPKP